MKGSTVSRSTLALLCLALQVAGLPVGAPEQLKWKWGRPAPEHLKWTWGRQKNKTTSLRPIRSPEPRAGRSSSPEFSPPSPLETSGPSHSSEKAFSGTSHRPTSPSSSGYRRTTDDEAQSSGIRARLNRGRATPYRRPSSPDSHEERAIKRTKSLSALYVDAPGPSLRKIPNVEAARKHRPLRDVYASTAESGNKSS